MNSVSLFLRARVPGALHPLNAQRLQRLFSFPLWASILVASVLSSMAVLSPMSARAEGVVTNCSTASFLAALAGGGRVTFSNNCTITLTKTVVIRADTTIEGSGASNVTITASAGTNAAGLRLFIVRPDVSLTLVNVTLSNGSSTNGGAIYNRGFLVASNCTFTGNRAVGKSGADGVKGDDDRDSGDSGGSGQNGKPGVGGAVFNSGAAEFYKCTFRLNRAVGGKGGKGGNGGNGDFEGGNGGRGGNGARGQGGAIYNAGDLYVADCTFSENIARGANGGVAGTPGTGAFPGRSANGGAGGGGLGAGVFNASKAEIVNSTFSNNAGRGGNSQAAGTSSSDNGNSGPVGGGSVGAGVCNIWEATIVNCTFFTNRVAGGAGGSGGPGEFEGGDGGNGGAASGGGIYNSGTIEVINVTLSSCNATGGPAGTNGPAAFPGSPGRAGPANGGNIANAGGAFFLKNSIVADSTSGRNGFGPITDEGNNISSDGSLGLTEFGSLNHTAPGLGPLQDNGGPTKTMALPRNSPAVDAGDDAACPETDQRGFPRTGAACDIGAYERNGPPAIVVDPLSQIASNGARVTFSVTAVGAAPLFYQWRFNEMNISGANGSSYTIAAVQATNAGNYDVVVSNRFGETLSGTATLTILVSLAIAQQPASQTVAQGGSVTFSVTALGSEPLSYQWRFNGEDLPGEVDSNLVIDGVQASHQGFYQVVVSNDSGSVTSLVATLTLLVSPEITGQPTSLSVTQGNTASFTVTAIGSAPLTYQWRFNGNNIAGATAETLTLTNVQPSSAGNYLVVVSNPGGAVTSVVATLTVQMAPATFEISGRILEGTNALADVTVMIDSDMTTTDTNGVYRFPAVLAGNYSVVPSRACYEFAPPIISVTVGPGTNNVNFAATAVSFTISGRVVEGTNGLAGVTVQAANQTALTDAGGNYTLTNVCAGMYSVEPSLSGYGFDFITVTVGPSTNGVDFIAKPLFSISGQVTDGTNGVGGIRISTDAGGTATTRSDGTYTLNVELPAGTYSVFPRQVTGMMICPTNQLVMLGPDATNVNFSVGIACITSLSRAGNGPVALFLTAVPNQSCLIQASTNLVTWESFCTTNAPADGLLRLLDTNALAFPARFYRAVSP